MSANMATLGLLKIKTFGNKGYGIVISFHDVTNKILLRESYYIVDSVIPLWWLQHFYGTGTRYHLNILHQCGKKIKTQSQKILSLIFTFVEITEENLVGWPFCPPPPRLPFLRSIKAADDETIQGHALIKKAVCSSKPRTFHE